MTVNAHDAEEQLRPYLREVVEEEAAHLAHMRQGTPLEQAYEAALDKALELLGVQR